jgi:predicted nucleic acid-binding protein
MRVEPFVDTNIWVYAHLDDASDPRCERAWELVNGLILPVISPQVIAEYYNVMLRNRRDDVWIQGNLEDMLEHCILQPPGRVVVSRAIAIRTRYGFSYWDCQIAALEAGCDTLFTEDLQPGQLIDGALTVANPLGT